MELLALIGGCAAAFFIAVACDVIGLVLLFVGVFADLRAAGGAFYGDFFIYSGALLVFVSLFLWLVWYAGNIPVPHERVTKRSSLARLARKFSERLGQTLRGEERAARVEVDGGSQLPPHHKASRVTWGRATAYRNQGYDGSEGAPEGPNTEGQLDI
ncbi:transmembrane protein 238-like [Antennarius striatus]|uniref:transmembrane protein 238-like n=1 Tax=Antennarius striatus TaxID=241820 RepID=UPI0035B10FEB